MAVSRNVAEGILGGHQPRDVAAAVALGILAGALAGGNLTFVPVLLAAILFNVHTRLFLAAWLASLLLAWLSGAWLEKLGEFLLDGTPLGRAVGLLGENTLVVLLGWDEYALVGGLAAGAAAAIAGAPLAFWMTCRLQRGWLAMGADLPNGKAKPDEASEGEHRAMVRVWYGPSRREQGIRRSMEPRRLRRYGIPASLAASVTVGIACWSLARLSAERELWRQLSAYNGAEVSCSQTQLSLRSGDFVVQNLAIADASRPDHDRFRIRVAKGRLSPGLLLRGRLHIDRLVVSQIRVDAVRHQPAQLYGVPDVDRDREAQRRLADHSPSPDELEISRYFRSWSSVCRRLGDLQQLVAAIERLPSAEGGAALSSGHRRSDLGRPQPRIVLRELRLDGLPSAWNLGSKALVELANLSSNPSLAKKPAQAKILLPKFGAEVQLDFAADDSQPHTIRCWACDVDVGQWLDAPLAVSGRVRLVGQGSCDGQRLDVRLALEAESLAAEVTGEEPLVGVEPQLLNLGLGQLTSCGAEVACFGSWTSPAISIDSRRLVKEFQQQLRAAGQEGLSAAIEQQIASHFASQAAVEEDVPLPVVVQATAIEAETAGVDGQVAGIEPASSQLPRCERPDECPATCRAGVAQPVESDADACSAYTYPKTSVPYDDQYSAPAASVAYDEAQYMPPSAALPFIAPAPQPVRPRPLPGPVKMAVGRDSYVGSRTPLAAFGVEPGPARREGLWERWTQGVRRKVGQVFARAEKAPAEPTESAEPAPDARGDDRAVPTAASEAWYGRRWR